MEHTNAYYLCVKLIQRGKTAGLKKKLEMYMAVDSITPEEFEALTGMLKQEEG